MISRDFIKRQLEELGRAIAKVISDMLKLKGLGKADKGLVLAEESLKSTFDLEIENILEAAQDNFVDVLIVEKKFSPAHLSDLGDLLYASAELFEAKNEIDKAKNLYQKVLTIFNYVNFTEKTFSLQRNNKIETIIFTKGIIN